MTGMTRPREPLAYTPPRRGGAGVAEALPPGPCRSARQQATPDGVKRALRHPG